MHLLLTIPMYIMAYLMGRRGEKYWMVLTLAAVVAFWVLLNASFANPYHQDRSTPQFYMTVLAIYMILFVLVYFGGVLVRRLRDR